MIKAIALLFSQGEKLAFKIHIVVCSYWLLNITFPFKLSQMY